MDFFKCPFCSYKWIREKCVIDELKLLECPQCGLCFLEIKQVELKSLYGKDYYQERAQYYFGEGNIRQFRKGLHILHQLKPQKGKLLDVGCGLGMFVKLAKHDGWEAKGVEISPFACAQARKDGLEVIEGELENLHLPSESFDVVTLWDAIEHFSDPFIKIKEIWRILKKDGLILLNTPNENSLLKNLAWLTYFMSFKKVTYPLKKLYHEYHWFYFRPRTLKQILKTYNFDILMFKTQPIPLIKARTSPLGKMVVFVFSLFERMTNSGYELFVIAKKG
jgi:2-polyprenyl-3-methyl-5-hydroxy-6-metoxy-1,4-benzoquinol methylase